MAFSEEMVQAVWEKGRTVTGQNANQWKQDECGVWIGRAQYGDRNSEYGWETDHINPTGSDDLSNLRPLQWQNNTDKSDGRLKCKVTAAGMDNVDSTRASAPPSNGSSAVPSAGTV
jgi:hypothetical protein